MGEFVITASTAPRAVFRLRRTDSPDYRSSSTTAVVSISCTRPSSGLSQ